MKVKMVPDIDDVQTGESGIHTIIREYWKRLPDYGIELVGKDATEYDLFAAHAGIRRDVYPDVCHLHGLYFTADFPSPKWQHHANQNIVESIRRARLVTIPSRWTAEILQRDLRIDPIVVPHGVDAGAWQHDEAHRGYVINYPKNRAGVDVCDPTDAARLAARFPETQFAATFMPENAPENVKTFGVLPHPKYKKLVQRAAVFVNTVKETFGLCFLEALAAGTPVLAYDHGGAADLIAHGETGYLADPGDLDDLAAGLEWCLAHRDALSVRAREAAAQWTWDTVCRQVVDVYRRTVTGDERRPKQIDAEQYEVVV